MSKQLFSLQPVGRPQSKGALVRRNGLLSKGNQHIISILADRS